MTKIASKSIIAKMLNLNDAPILGGPLKKLILSCAVTFAVALAPTAYAVNVQPPVFQDQSAGGLSDSTFALNLEFLGTQQVEVSVSTNSTSPILAVSGSGLLYGVDASSGVAGAYCLGLDSAVISGITITLPNGGNGNGLVITPSVMSPAITNGVGGATGCTVPGVCGSWFPRVPVRFNNGLVALKSNAGADCIYHYRSDAQNAVLGPTR